MIVAPSALKNKASLAADIKNSVRPAASVDEVHAEKSARNAVLGELSRVRFMATQQCLLLATHMFIQKSESKTSVPLLWIQHVLPMKTRFPIDSFRKEQWIRSTSESRKLLVANSNMILMRRFSPKEDFRRLTVAPYLGSDIEAEFLGLENHLNYIYRPNGQFSKKLVFGLAAFLNSKLFDSYFRITNGNTQVSATELRAAKLPPQSKLEEIGALLSKTKEISHETIDAVVNEVLQIELNNEKDN